ncbi:MAG: hypothetical protein ACYDDO_14545 [Acidiferrobacterales bacterium]
MSGEVMPQGTGWTEKQSKPEIGESKMRFNTRKPLYGVLFLFSTLLSACGGGGGSSNSTPSAVATLTGVVASGNPIVQASVKAIDINGKTVTGTADGNGNYSLTVTNLTPPVALVATDPQGLVQPLVTVLASLPAAGQSAIANVTTLTSALSALLTTDGNAMDFVTSGATTSLSAVTATKVQAALTTLNTYLAKVLSANNISPSTFNPITTAFTAGTHMGVDAVIDLVQVVPQGTATYLTGKVQSSTSNTRQSAVSLNLNSSTVSSTSSQPAPLAAPASAVVTNLSSLSSFLNVLPSALSSCLATSSTCAGLIDSSYMDNGFTTIQTYLKWVNNALPSSSSLSFGAPQIITINASGTNALISIPFAISSATSVSQYSFATTVQYVSTPISLSGGTQVNWDIIGNQLQYNASVRTRATRQQFYDQFSFNNVPDTNRYDAGIDINFGTQNGANISAVNSVLVTGPGLPGAGLYLQKSTISGIGFVIASLQPTSPPTSATTLSNTIEYRWSWTTMPGAATTFTPPSGIGFWSTTNLDITTLPAYATYTFTLYDSSGIQIGTSFQVTNPAPAIDSTFAQNTAWATLGSDVVTNFLSATGSESGAQTSVPVDFTTVPYEPSLHAVAILNGQSGGVGCDASKSLSAGATSTTVTAPSVCSNNFLAIDPTVGTYRIVQLRAKTVQGVQVNDNHVYRDSDLAPGGF